MSPSQFAHLGTAPHSIHLALVVLGLTGVLALLVPTLVAVRPERRLARSDHDERVRELAGRLGVSGPVSAMTRMPRRGAPRYRGFARMAAVVTCAAGAVHLFALPHHLDHGALVALGFVTIGAVQVCWGVAVARALPGERFLTAGAAGNAALILLWVASRTASIPGVPGTPEPVGGLDLTTVGLELVAVIGCLVAIAVARRTHSLTDTERS